ncbi:MAG: hypothetical protein EOP46_14410, partial [Sphingobacteriaceae bacterium]
MRKSSLLIAAFTLFFGAANAQTYTLQSPDKHLQVNIVVNDSITYAVSYKNNPLITPSAISLTLDKGILGKSAKVIKTKTGSHNA